MTKTGYVPILLLAGCAAALEPPPPGALAFGVLGDAPYSAEEVRRLDEVIGQMNAQELAFVVHVGDLGTSTPAQACGDAWLEARKAQLGRIRHRLVVIPGDNEWSECKDPLGRLAKWRALFCEAPGELCEHRTWEAGGWVFVALNVAGGNNNLGHPEHGPRMQAVLAKLDEAARLAESREGLVILLHADPFFYPRVRDGYASLKQRLREWAGRSPGKVVLIHGDTHIYLDDQPLPGLRRVEVWGSPFVGWLRVLVRNGALVVEEGR